MFRRTISISIHSTARVETVNWETGDVMILGISIHSTARVETNTASQAAATATFQSTPPRGWRLNAMLGVKPYKEISIHSTARVETV